jgi:protein arginine kinase activator
MKCRNCAKLATLHITEINKGIAHEVHLCEECAMTYLNKTVPGGETQADDEEGEPTTASSELDEVNALTCPTCGASFGDFRQAGRLGCSRCYAAFKEQLVPLLENVHGDTRHVGKFPRRVPRDSGRQFELIKLRNDLRLAVEEERYEAAAQLRDQIQSLESASGETPGETSA